MWQIYHSVVLCVLCAVFAFLFFNSVVVITILILVLAGVIAFHDFPLNDFSFHVASLKCWLLTLYYCVLNMYNQNCQMSDNRMFSDSNGLSSNNIGLFNRKNTSKTNYNLYTIKNDTQLSQTYNSSVSCSVNSSPFSVTKLFEKASNTPKSYGHNDVSISKSHSLPRRPLISPTRNDNSKNLQMPASPLVSSSRYNATLDPKLYADVSSPGFCGRVAQKLSEAKTHQTKYGGVGIFPVVNLNKSPKHYLSPHNSQAVAKSPVRVRIAPPDSSYTSVNSSVFLRETDRPMKSVLQVLKEISRKRIHSEINDDDETVKRIRTGDYQEPVTPINTESSGQGKRAREDSQPNSGEETKRRRHFRNNEIHSSLSSSIKSSLYSHGLKRKAYSSADDGSRSSSPVLGKLLKVQVSSPTFVCTPLPPRTSMPVYVPVPDDDTPQVCNNTESADAVHKEIKENLQPLLQEAAVNELKGKKILEANEVSANCKSQNGSENATGGRRFMGRDLCLVNCGKAPVAENPKRREKVVEESRINLVPPVNRQKRLTELLRAIDGEATVTSVVDEKAQQEIIDSSKAVVSPSGILLAPKLPAEANNNKAVKSVTFSEPICVVKEINNVADAHIPALSGNSVSAIDSDSQKELSRIPSVLKVENPFTDKQRSPFNTGFTAPQFNVQNSNLSQPTTSLHSSPLQNKISTVTVPTTENVSNKVEAATSSPVTVNTVRSGVDSTPLSKPGGFSFDLKVDKKVTEKSTDFGTDQEAVGKPFLFSSTEDKTIMKKPLLFGNKDIKTNIENTLYVSPKSDNIKNITFGATETKKVECTEEKKSETISTTITSNFCSPVSSLSSSTPSPKFTFSSLSSPVTDNRLNIKLPTSISQTNSSNVLKQNSPTTKEETQLQSTSKSDSEVYKSKQSVVTTVIGNPITDAVTSKGNETESVSVSDPLKTQSSQNCVNQTFMFNSPVTSHSTQQFNNTFGSNSKTVFSIAMDKKQSTDKDAFGNICMNSPHKDSTQGFGNIFNKDGTNISNTLTKNIFGAITKEGQNKTDRVVSTFANSDEDVKNESEIFTDGFVRNNVVQQKIDSSGSFSSDKPVTNGFTFTSSSDTAVTKPGIFSNVFNTSQIQTSSNTTTSFTPPKFKSAFGSFNVQSTTSSSSGTPTFSFGSTNNTPNTGSVFGNIPTNAFSAANSGNASGFSGLNQSNFSATENKAGFGATSPFTFGSGNSPASNFMFGSKQPTTVSETPVFGNNSFKPTESKVFTFGGSSLNQTAGPATGVFTFGQTGPATAQPVFQFSSGSNVSSQPSAGGFNFGSSTTPAVPAFQMGSSAPPKSMFSIGTGSTAPRSKSVARSRRLK